MCESRDGAHIDDGYDFDFYGSRVEATSDIPRRVALASALGSALLYVPAASRATTSAAHGLSARLVDAAALGAPAGLMAQTHAMHLHASYCEGIASLASHLREAARAKVDFMHYTVHDNRAAIPPGRYRDSVLLSSASEPVINGRSWQWARTAVPTGCLAQFDRRAGTNRSAMHLRSTTKTTAETVVGFKADTRANTNLEHRGNIGGRRFQPSIYIGKAQGQAWMELRLHLSMQASGKQLILKYRFGPTGTGIERPTASELVIFRPCPVGVVTQPEVFPDADVATYWPEVVATDNSVTELYLHAVARKSGLVDGYFSGMRMVRTVTGQDALDAAQDTLDAVVARTPTSVISRLGVEFSNAWHVNGYGGRPGVAIPLYDAAARGARLTTADFVDHIHAHDGYAIYNHPFGVLDPGSGADTPAVQKQRVLAEATDLTANRVFGADGIEIAYYLRGRVDLANHMYLGELLVANGIFATWTGVSDNHTGIPGSWTTAKRNNFVTQLWADGTDEDSHATAIQQGLACVSLLGAYAGQLWVSLDDAPMGSASVRPGVTSRQLGVGVTQVPTGGRVEVVKGKVGYAASGAPLTQPGCTVVATLAPADLPSGNAEVVVATETSCFFYLRVRDAAGSIVAFTNPVIHLTSTPPSRGAVSDRRLIA